MASDKITEIVDQSAFAQVDKLKLDLKALTDQFVQLFGGVEQFKKALAGASTSGGLSGGINSTTKSLTALEKATQQQIELANRLRVAEHSVFQERELAKQQNAELNKQNALHVKMVNAEVGSYDEMQAKLSQLTMKYKAMGAAQREAMGKDTLANIQKYEKGLQDIDKTMGKFNRNVGNYQNQTFQLSQVFREIPAFTYSATTGILALSNNLPMLADGFKQVATATNDATGKVNGTMGALKIFAKSIFSWTNAFTIAIGLITIFSKEIMEFINGTDEASEGITDFKKALEDSSKAVGSEIALLQRLYDTATDTTKSYNERKLAVDELQKLYPNYLKNIKDEAIMAGDAAAAYREINEALVNKAIFQAYESQIGEMAAKLPALQKQLKDLQYQKSLLDKPKSFEDMDIGGTYSPAIPKNVQDVANNPSLALERDILSTKNRIDGIIIMMRKAYEEAAKYSKGITELTINPEKGKKAKDEKDVNRIKALKDEYEMEVSIIEQAKNKNEITENEYHLRMIESASKYYKQRKGLRKEEIKSESEFNLELTKVLKEHSTNFIDTWLKETEKFNKLEDEKTKKLREEFAKRKKEYDEYAAYIDQQLEAQQRMHDRDDAEKLKNDEDYNKAKYNLYAESLQAINSIGQVIHDIEMARIDAKEKRIEEYYNNELRFIEQSGFSEAEKEKRKRKLEIETETKRKEIDRDRIKAKRKEASIAKATGILIALANITAGITRAFKDYAFPISAVMAAAVGVAGASQIAALVATPLPQYAEGTDYHKGGSFIAGEKGVEQVILPSGKSFLTPSSATLFPDMPQGTKVINNKDLMQQVYNSAIVKLSTQGQVTPQKMMEAQMMAFEEMTDEVKGLRHDLRAKELTATFQDYAGFRNYKNSNIR